MNYFSILNELFSTERLYKIIKDAPSNGKIDTPEVLGSFYNNAFKINDLEPLSLIKYLYNQILIDHNYNNDLIKEDLRK